MENILSAINLSTTTAPVVTEHRGEDWIDYGTEDWANLYPQFLIDLYYNSSTQAAIINSTADLIAGDGLVIEDEDDRDLETVVKLKKFFAYANGNETLDEVIKKISFDFKLQGAFALNIVWSEDRTQIAEIYHIAVEKIRCEKPDALGKVNGYFVSSDWSDIRTNPPYRVAAFNTHDRTSPNQILYTGLYSPNMNAYHTPDYVAANNWALVDQRVAEYHLNNISNGFSGSFMISFANGVPTQEERFQIEQSLAAKFTGSDNAGKFILTFADDKTRTPDITPISPSDLDKQYLSLQELLVQNILTGHRITSKTLMGIDSSSGFSSNADELNAASNYYLNTVCKPYQHIIVKTLRKIFTVNNMDMPVMFEQLKPITTKFTNQDLAGVLTPDEIREEMGYAPLEEDVEIREDLSKESKVITLEAFLDTLEDIPEDWELIEEKVVDGEHQDFDFETVLNELANDKTELASTGTARPNSKSSQDGVNKSYNEYYKVRYVYAEDKSLINKTGQERPFCTKMMSAGKIYRKQDILQMSDLVVNDYYYSDKQGRNIGWGANGDLTYSIWLSDQGKDCCNSLKTSKLELYKGGGNCQHFWLRQIYKTSLRNAKNNISESQLISSANAKSEGFTIEKNDNLVARAPKTMKNNGFLNPR
tara:strand:- start:1076 stop:3019 length:1944 start_codon:yes stop_codon:yes gene_type:complete